MRLQEVKHPNGAPVTGRDCPVIVNAGSLPYAVSLRLGRTSRSQPACWPAWNW
jgi:hypothetical protein